MLCTEHEHHFVLHVVGVLVLINQDVAETTLIGLENIGVFAEQLDGIDE